MVCCGKVQQLFIWFVSCIALVILTFNHQHSELIFSTLDELRSTAKEGGENLLHPKRILPILQGRPNIVVLACRDTHLVVGLETGSVLVYDANALLCPGSGVVAPLVISQLQSGPLRQILPNPGTESNLVDIVAVLGDGMVQLLNMGLQLQGGWVPDGSSPNPMASSYAVFLALFVSNVTVSFLVSQGQTPCSRLADRRYFDILFGQQI